MTGVLEEAAQDADLRARRQASRREALEAVFLDIAEGKLWYEGTGQDDKIFPHQWTGMMFGAVARRWFLGDTMGLGKTRTSIGWMDLVGAKKVLIVAEANIAAQFAGEVMELAPHRTIIVLTGNNSKTRKDRSQALLTFYREAVVVINYEIFRRDQESLTNVLKWQADTIIVDEAHNMKNVSTSNFKTVQKLIFTDNKCEKCGGLIFTLKKPCPACRWMRVQESLAQSRTDLKHYLATKSIENVLLMSGTPILNQPLDLYSSLHLIDPSTFPTEAAFKRTFLKPSYVEGSRKMVFRREGLKRLHPLIKNFFLARSLDDVGKRVPGGLELPGGRFLPDQHVRIVRVEVDPQQYPLQARTIAQVSEQARIMLSTGEAATLMHMITIILRKRQANVWPGGITFRDQESGEVIFSVGKEVQESAKMDACLEQLQAYHRQGHRQVVFSQFKTALEEFEKRCKEAGLRTVRLDGDTPKKLREEIKTNFYRAKGETPKWDVVLAHYRTGGTGLNLTSCTVTHILDEEWNAGKRDQGYGRTHRIGQTEATEVLIYRVPNSVDSWMASLIATKEKLAKDLHRTMSSREITEKIADAIKKGEI